MNTGIGLKKLAWMGLCGVVASSFVLGAPAKHKSVSGKKGSRLSKGHSNKPSGMATKLSMIRTIANLKAVSYATSPYNSHIAIGLENNEVKIISAASGATLKTLKGLERPAYALAFSPDGKKLATGDESGRVTLWNSQTAQKIAEMPRGAGHTRGVQYLSFSLDGKQLASTGRDDSIKIWNVQNKKPIKTILGHGDNFNSATYTQGKLVVGTLGKGFCFYKLGSYERIASHASHENRGINDIDVNKSGTKALTAGRDGRALVWNLSTKQPIAKLQGHSDWVSKISLSPDSRYAATSSSDRKVILWNLHTYKPIAELNNQSTVGSPIAFTADNRYLITADAAENVQIYKLH